MLHRVNSLLQSRVPIVLNSIVCSTQKFFGYQTPFLLALVAEDEEHPLLLLRPLSALDLGVEVVEPSLSAALSASAIEGVRKISPHHMFSTFAFLVDVSEDDLVLLRSPVTNAVGRGFLKLCGFHVTILLLAFCNSS